MGRRARVMHARRLDMASGRCRSPDRRRSAARPRQVHRVGVKFALRPLSRASDVPFSAVSGRSARRECSTTLAHSSRRGQNPGDSHPLRGQRRTGLLQEPATPFMMSSDSPGRGCVTNAILFRRIACNDCKRTVNVLYSLLTYRSAVLCRPFECAVVQSMLGALMRLYWCHPSAFRGFAAAHTLCTHGLDLKKLRSFWGLVAAYWISERWREAWALTVVALAMTALLSKASVWTATASADFIAALAEFHHPDNADPAGALLLSGLALFRDLRFPGRRRGAAPSGRDHAPSPRPRLARRPVRRGDPVGRAARLRPRQRSGRRRRAGPPARCDRPADRRMHRRALRRAHRPGHGAFGGHRLDLVRLGRADRAEPAGPGARSRGAGAERSARELARRSSACRSPAASTSRPAPTERRSSPAAWSSSTSRRSPSSPG